MNEAELSDFPARVWRKPSVSTLTCSINGCLPQSAIYLFYSSRYGLYRIQQSYINVIMLDNLYDISQIIHDQANLNQSKCIKKKNAGLKKPKKQI